MHEKYHHGMVRFLFTFTPCWQQKQLIPDGNYSKNKKMNVKNRQK